jgi:hypothetical protein
MKTIETILEALCTVNLTNILAGVTIGSTLAAVLAITVA